MRETESNKDIHGLESVEIAAVMWKTFVKEERIGGRDMATVVST
jgi:hypothetical protein